MNHFLIYKYKMLCISLKQFPIAQKAYRIFKFQPNKTAFI
jgi:hypothetical protein